MLEGKNILLGVCGSIAAYKSAVLIRLLVKAGANVKVIMTRDASAFITPLTLSTLSKNPVLTEYFNPETGVWNNHVELALWADLLLIAPVTANSLARLANGLCDDLLGAVYLSARSPVYLAPAMDLDMWKHPATQRNVSTLAESGNLIIRPGNGELASGLSGEGRMAEPEHIVNFLDAAVNTSLPLRGRKALVTAGPTYEPIDPVRFIGNHATGKMGFAIAEELDRLGAEVTLISGPSALQLKSATIRRIDVMTSEEMGREAGEHFPLHDIMVMNAAVADYRPKVVENFKIKKEAAEFGIDLVKTTDILSALGKSKRDNQVLVGFALETNNEEENAVKKLHKKNLDFIVLNSLRDEGAGFGGDTNKITIIDKSLNKESFELKRKEDVAKDICRKILEML
jgi:phosphopantothenoylcysteine decarboxylase / phosphopantothenate---cysteine ligase